MGEVLILLGRKLGQLTSRSTRVAFERQWVGGEGIQVILGKGLVLRLCSPRAAQKRGKPVRTEWENQGLGTGKEREKQKGPFNLCRATAFLSVGILARGRVWGGGEWEAAERR